MHNNKEPKKAFLNRAEITNAKRICCDNCFEQTVFALRDKDHEFSLGMTTILQCLEFAQREGEIPPLPPEWWRAVNSRYKDVF